MSEKYTEGVKFMNALAEASFLVRKIAEPAPAGDSVKGAILRAYRRLGTWTHNRVRDVWYGDHRISVSGDELNQLRALARQQTESARDTELEEMRAWMATLQSRLERLDSEFFVREIEGLSASASSAGGRENEPGRDGLSVD